MLKEILIFVGGGVVGYFAGKYVTETKYKEIMEKELHDMEIYYEAKHPEKPKRENGYGSSHVMGEIKTMNEPDQKPNKVDYTTYYDPAESESPEEDDNEMMDDTDTGESITNEYMANKSKPPKIIKGTEFGNEPGFSTMTLLYYQENDVLTIHDGQDYDEEDIIYFDEIEDFIGDALVRFGFTDNDEERIYVRNYNRATDFEVVKVFGAFEG